VSKVLVLATYELGMQPLGAAVPAALFEGAGHEVRQRDLSIEDWPDADVAWADAIACSVPMHTALRLGLEALQRVREARPEIPFAFHGLYAPMVAETDALRDGDVAIGGDGEDELLDWIGRVDAAMREAPRHIVHLAPVKSAAGLSSLPKRAGLPGLDRYARFVARGEEFLVGSVEATRGCNHRCRHCPVPVIYDGRSRPNDPDAVLADIDQVVAMGASHIHFADADFLNRPRHAQSIARRLHDAHPLVTFDATIKVSHILRHRGLFRELAAYGLRFVVSAFESTNDTVLEHLAKGHTRADEIAALEICRAEGIEIRPSLLPFTPWTTRAELVDLLDFVLEHDLVWNIDPVQFGVRLLIPPGSLLLEHDDVTLREAITGYQPSALGYVWRSPDALLDQLQLEIAELCEKMATDGLDNAQSYEQIRALVYERLGLDNRAPRARTLSALSGPDRPRLTEAWFCCAEPTSAQVSLIASRGPAADACANDECC
jgi:hypothetical protein